jgi:hypothetical protein
MALSRVSHAIALGDTLSMPSHQFGDLIIGVAYNSLATGTGSFPSTPSGQNWRIVSRAPTSTSSDRTLLILEKTALSSSESFGIATNATHVGIIVYRNTTNFPTSSEGSRVTRNNSGNTIRYGTVNTLAGNWYYAIGGTSTENPEALSAPDGMTTIAYISGSGGTLLMHDTNGIVPITVTSNIISGTNISPTVATKAFLITYPIAIPTTATTTIDANSRGGYSN